MGFGRRNDNDRYDNRGGSRQGGEQNFETWRKWDYKGSIGMTTAMFSNKTEDKMQTTDLGTLQTLLDDAMAAGIKLTDHVRLSIKEPKRDAHPSIGMNLTLSRYIPKDRSDEFSGQSQGRGQYDDRDIRSAPPPVQRDYPPIGAQAKVTSDPHTGEFEFDEDDPF